jgi:hypothetical protein
MATKKNEEVMEQGMTLEQMQAQMAAMLAEAQSAKAEAERLLSEAQKMTNGKMKTAERAAEIEADKARGEELVSVKLFKDTGKYKDDVFVGCNGENCLIQRGERVEIKRKYAEILDNSEHQDYETAQMIEQKSAEWAYKAKAL